MTTDNGATSQELRDENIRGSVVEEQTQVTQAPYSTPESMASDYGLFWVSAAADGIVPWGTAPTYRDRQLRSFLPNEPFTMSAIATVIASNMGLSWVLDGQPASVARTQDILHAAQFGDGWEAWNSKIGWDFYGQDKGAFAELVRTEDNPRAPVVGINQLDAIRCWHTGNRQTPVLYQDRLGKWHGLKWYQVLTLAEMPVSHETLYGIQLSALTRVLNISQIIRNILLVNLERTGGQHARTVFIINGVRKNEIQTALQTARTNAQQQGMTRYMEPVIVPTTDPNAKPEVTELRMADLPDGFSDHMDEYFKWFMTAIAMGLLRDLQDFMPLPGGNLGTSAQSSILHMKTRGKGPAIWTKKIEHAFNFHGVVPPNVTFRFDETDIEEEHERAEMFSTYATALNALIAGRVSDPAGARKMLLDNRMISQEMYDELEKRSKDFEVVEDNSPEADRGGRGGRVGRDNQDSGATGNGTADDGERRRGTALGQRDMTIDLDDDRLFEEGQLTERAQRALEINGRDAARELRKSVR